MSSVSTSRKSSAGKNVLVFFIVFIILEMLIIFGIGKVFKNKDVTPSIMGYSLFMTKEDLVQNGSDGAVVAVPKNVLVIASDGLPDPKSKIGCAILCEKVEGVGAGVFWLADMNSEEGKNGVDYTVTNGTQGYVIHSNQIVGVCASYFVTAGKVISFVTQKFGMICCAVVPLFLLVLIELIIAIATHSSGDDDEDDDEDDEDEEEEKSVELDDFLFGGQNEGEQIAKRRKKKPLFEEEDEDEDEEDDSDFRPQPKKKTNPLDEFDAPVSKKKPAPVQEDDFDFQPKRNAAPQPAAAAPVQEEAPAATGSLRLQDDEVMSKYYEKASQLVDGTPAAEETPAPAERPARRPDGARRPRRRRPAGAGTKVSSDTSLEDLMKLMEEEQNKLKNQMK
ncbi:hypothetical protein [Ruminococcus sp.]|uniref:hypothetical protein n=1 Tax=Ruminococcus sp. TaxID=41978 RepID=UPI0025DA9CC8|nr:hypothetical protein [Ruminococcus sp.]MBQ8965685.1 hypothetical protein [Ruminococcus sp.]